MAYTNTGFDGRTPQQMDEHSELQFAIADDSNLANIFTPGKFPEIDETIQTAKLNCSLCTAAGIVRNLTQHKRKTSGDVARDLQLGNYQHRDAFLRYQRNKGCEGPEETEAAPFNDTLKGMSNYFNKFGLNTTIDTNIAGLGSLARWMERTQHVYCAVSLHADFSNHWLVAHRVMGTFIRYIDYQCDHPKYGGTPRYSGHPMIGVTGEEIYATSPKTVSCYAIGVVAENS
ncbi:hypothetical protein AB833_08055 [Chromatiales bacterium (ex Bugula neritina AB1)]|nr:hypothetical protein AB833_08055 [Chromatiales bacterium (ex Bugula neritina AB1)]